MVNLLNMARRSQFYHALSTVTRNIDIGFVCHSLGVTQLGLTHSTLKDGSCIGLPQVKSPINDREAVWTAVAERHKQSVCRICAMNGSETKSSWRNDSRNRPEKQDAETWQIRWEKIEREQSSAADEMNGKLQLTAELCKAESRTELNPWADKDSVWKISQISCRVILVIIVIMFAYVTLTSVNLNSTGYTLL